MTASFLLLSYFFLTRKPRQEAIHEKDQDRFRKHSDKKYIEQENVFFGSGNMRIDHVCHNTSQIQHIEVEVGSHDDQRIAPPEQDRFKDFIYGDRSAYKYQC